MKIKSIFFLLLLILLPLSSYCNHEKAVTFGWGGRLGDNILDYTHAKWISYKYGIPLLFKSFEYSDQFVFSDVEEHLTSENQLNYTQVTLKNLDQLNKKLKRNTLYFLPHACDSYVEYVFNGLHGLYVPVDWSDKTFREMMKTLIAPKYPLKLTYPPSNIISVALHFRTGGGFVWDTDSMKKGLPLRFPEPEYYIKQLSRLHKFANYKPMYVYIFTDHPEPGILRKLLEDSFSNKNIQFDCRLEGNMHDVNVLEDLFSMINFDCLVRPMSHYSMTASHLGDFKFDFVPKHGYWENNKFIVDQVDIIKKGTL